MDCPKHSSHPGYEPRREIHQGASSSSELQGHSGEGVGGEEMEQDASSSDSANEGDFPILRITAILHPNKDGSYKCEKVSKSDPRNDKYRELGRSPRESGSPSYKEKERMMNSSQLREMPWAERAKTFYTGGTTWRLPPQQKKKVKQRVLPSSEEMIASKEAVRKFENIMQRMQQIKDVEEEEQDQDCAIKTPSSGVQEGDAQSGSDSWAELEYHHLLDLPTDAEREEVKEKSVKMKLKNKPLPQREA